MKEARECYGCLLNYTKLNLTSNHHDAEDLVSQAYLRFFNSYNKGKGGFYRMNKKDGNKVLEAINLTTKDYSPSKKIDLNIDEKVNLKELVSRNDKYEK